jgi:single-strand DNA-binding protein
MNDLNYCIIDGNLVKDPDLRSTTNGTTICNFSVASNRFFDNRKEVSFFDVEAWGNLGKNCSAMGCKGRGVRIIGRLKQDRWEAEGINKSRVRIIAEHVEWKPEKKGDTKTYSWSHLKNRKEGKGTGE